MGNIILNGDMGGVRTWITGKTPIHYLESHPGMTRVSIPPSFGVPLSFEALRYLCGFQSQMRQGSNTGPDVSWAS